MEYAVPLATLPDGVKFPDRLRERVRFSPETGRLVFQGFMTKCTYDELSALTDDVAYHRALEELFVLTSAEMSGHAPKWPLPTAAVVAAGCTALLLGLMVWVALRHSPSGSKTKPTPDVRVSAIAR